MKMGFLFTSESVSEGHPDKVSDQISDAILDEFLRRDANSKVACETLCTTGLVVVAGEVRSDAYVDVQGVARRVINRIGYTKSEYQFDCNSCGILSAIHEQSSDINQGVVRADIATPDDGFCVVAHEIAHKLDALDGAMDGTPPLPRDWQRQWASDFQRAYEGLCNAVDAGRETTIDPYAAESPEEFFAVCTEHHFSDSATLRKAMPDVAAHLQRFYGPAMLDSQRPL